MIFSSPIGAIIALEEQEREKEKKKKRKRKVVRNFLDNENLPMAIHLNCGITLEQSKTVIEYLKKMVKE